MARTATSMSERRPIGNERELRAVEAYTAAVDLSLATNLFASMSIFLKRGTPSAKTTKPTIIIT